jgi:hypothetical protein
MIISPVLGLNSVGAPVQLQIPYNARIMNPACVTTGGKRKTRRSRRAGRKSRKNRKTTRKSRKSSRTANRR